MESFVLVHAPCLMWFTQANAEKTALHETNAVVLAATLELDGNQDLPWSLRVDQLLGGQHRTRLCSTQSSTCQT